MKKNYEIAGFKVTPSEYQRLSFVIGVEKDAGWKPTRNDIKSLIKSDRHPSLETKRGAEKMAEDVKRDE